MYFFLIAQSSMRKEIEVLPNKTPLRHFVIEKDFLNFAPKEDHLLVHS